MPSILSPIPTNILRVDAAGPYTTWALAKTAHRRGKVIEFAPAVHEAQVQATSYAATASSVTRASGILTVSATAHGKAVGDRVLLRMTSVNDLAYEGESIVRTVANANTFTCGLGGSDGTSSGGGQVLGATIIHAHGAVVRNTTGQDEFVLGNYHTSPELIEAMWVIVRGGTWMSQVLSGDSLNSGVLGITDTTSHFDIDVDAIISDESSEAVSMHSVLSDLKLRCSELVNRASYGLVLLGARNVFLDIKRIKSTGYSISIQADGVRKASINVGEMDGGFESYGGAAGDQISVNAQRITGLGNAVNLHTAGEATVQIASNLILATGGPAVIVKTGTAKRVIMCPRIESTYNDVTGVPIDLSTVTTAAEVLSLGPCSLVAGASALVGIKGPSSGSVKLRLLGHVRSNKPLGANITIVGDGTFTEDATVS